MQIDASISTSFENNAFYMYGGIGFLALWC
jgi:hypothetical protein